MKEIKKVYLHNIIDKYRFYGIVLIILLIVSLIFRTAVSSAITYIIVIPILIIAVLFINDYLKMNSFINSMNLSDEYRIIDTAVFTKDMVYSRYYNEYLSFTYKDIESVTHEDNIFEKVRPPYEGIHGVKITLENGKITVIKVKDGIIAERICSLINTKNSNVKLYGVKNPEKTELKNLDNYQVNTRF